MSRKYVTRPPHKIIHMWIKKEPERLYKDELGRLYGKRHDEAFESFEQEAWFVHLPPPSHAHETVDEVVNFPREQESIEVVNLKNNDKKTLIISEYPEAIYAGHKTASVNLEVQ